MSHSAARKSESSVLTIGTMCWHVPREWGWAAPLPRTAASFGDGGALPPAFLQRSSPVAATMRV